MAPALPSGLRAFVEHVLPILRRAGLFREEYEGSTLREHYGLGVPPNQFRAGRPARAYPPLPTDRRAYSSSLL